MKEVRGKILSVNSSLVKGEKKRNIDHGVFVENLGLEGDAHAESGIRQVSLLATESVEKIRAKGLDAGYGDFAENLTTEGIDLPALPAGARLRIGSDVLLEITQIGKVCHDRCVIFHAMGDCVMPREGVFARVLIGGEVWSGDMIRLYSIMTG